MANDKKKFPPFLDTQRLREVHRAAEVYASATGNITLLAHIASALEEAEKWEDQESYANCINCGARVPVGRKYCGFV